MNASYDSSRCASGLSSHAKCGNGGCHVDAGHTGWHNLHGENMEITVPLVHSTRSYSYLMNTPAMGQVYVNGSGQLWRFNAAVQFASFI